MRFMHILFANVFSNHMVKLARIDILHELVASNKGQLMVGDFLCDVHVCIIQDSMG